MTIFLILTERLRQAIALPDLYYSWKTTLLAIGIYSAFSIALGWQTGFIKWQPQPSKIAIRIMITSLIAPAMIEEIWFRVLLLPVPSNTPTLQTFLTASWFSLYLFIIYHPLNAVTFFPQGRKTFFDPVFLTLATALGVVCTWSYWQNGSLWVPVLIHWLTVVLWLSYLGGWDKLGFSTIK